MMKKKIILFLVAIACLSLSACGKENAAQMQTSAASEASEVSTETEETSTEESTMQIDNGEDSEYDVTIDMKDDSEEIKNEEGVFLLRVTESFPDVTIDGSAAAADNINDFYAKEKESFEASIEETKQMAEEDYKFRMEDNPDSWKDENAYEMGTSYEVKRSDDQCISIVNDTYSSTGGAHPNSARFAATFDTASGEKLTLDNLFQDAEKAKSFINDYLLKEMKDKEEEGMFFDDYEKDVPSILDDNTWYLSKEGFVVICNEYIVSPHAAGIMEYTIPYSEFSNFSELYKPAAK